ncbi:D-Ala-D-Ala carboxypeptidase family metallohydrolase [Mesorhizobium newzealandense]|uniref:D-Ala-D-Ala carboxypeptidase family metallohydrolase n=1 Tax=Mesorhizobium newzealandense TaxID=1300302 RepID=A0ABW4UJB3_9HYPH
MSLKPAGWSLAKGERRAIVAALCSVLLASCTSAGDPTMSVGMPGYNATASDISAASSGTSTAVVDSTQTTTEQTTVMTASDTALPEKVAYVPIANPQAAFPLTTPAGTETIAGNTPQSLQQPAQTAQQTDAVAQQIAAADAGVNAPKSAAAPAMDNPVYVTAGEMPQADAPKKKGFLASMFGATPASAAPAPLINTRSGEPPAAQAKPEPAAAKPIITLASVNSTAKPVQLASIGGDTGHITGSDALPGVRQTALFEIKRKSGLDDESDVDLNEDEGPIGGSYQVASAAGLARLAPNGLLKQNESVDVACLKPSLVRVLKTIEGHYGRKMVVTSGYRDPARNRRANGAKNSLHMYCAAADIQVPGVSKWELASYIRTMPGRGGVGTYCHTESVHVDVGPERDWNWRCRRRSGGGDG